MVLKLKFSVFILHLLLLLQIASRPVFADPNKVRYDNYPVYKLIGMSLEQKRNVEQLARERDSFLPLDKTTIVVAPHKEPEFADILKEYKIKYEVIERNYQKLFDLAGQEEIVAELSPNVRNINYKWDTYYKLDDTYRWLQQLPLEYPNMVELITVGTSYENRSILGVKINTSNCTKSKPGIFLEAGIHAREWISSATATWIINELLTSRVPAIRSMAENYQWYIVPHANPDGHVYTQTDRMWRKSRSKYNNCFGADLNRNWDWQWNAVGTSNNPCSQLYAGPQAFSEIETKTMASYLQSLKVPIPLYISFHAFGQLLLYPYGHTAELPSNHKDLKQVFDVAIAAIHKRYGSIYKGGNIYDAIYPASGSSIDWAYARLNSTMSFCYELRPSKAYPGFRLPAKQIIPTAKETMDSIVAMVNEVQKLGYFRMDEQ